MSCVEGIAAGATKWTFFSDFDRERRGATRENTGPGVEDFRLFHCFSETDRVSGESGCRGITGAQMSHLVTAGEGIRHESEGYTSLMLDWGLRWCASQPPARRAFLEQDDRDVAKRSRSTCETQEAN